MPPEAGSISIEKLESEQERILDLAVETAQDLRKFYVDNHKVFRRSLYNLPVDTENADFSTASAMTMSALQGAIPRLQGTFKKQGKAELEEISSEAFSRYLNKQVAYRATASGAFGDFNPLTSAILLRSLLQDAAAVTELPLILRLSTRIVLSYVITTVRFDLPRMRGLFGRSSIWSLRENHTMILFRCVDALSGLLRMMEQNSFGNEWARRCFGRLQNAEIRSVMFSVRKDDRRGVRARLQWLNTESFKYHFRQPRSEMEAAELLRTLLDDLARWARDIVNLQMAQQGRKEGREFDAAYLAGALAMISIGSTTIQREELSDGLEALFRENQASGVWPVGRPFFYDDIGSAYHSVSIEIAYAALRAIGAFDATMPRLALGRMYDLFHEQLANIYRWIDGARMTVALPPTAHVKSLDGEIARQCRGWSNDRSPGVGRIDGWMSALVLDFLVEDHRLRKDYVRRVVLSRYHVTPWERCSPEWNELVDPDKGQKASLKSRLDTACVRRPSGSECVSVLLYGPPGTSKTTIVKALARGRRADLLELNAGDFVQDGLELLESRARTIFSDLSRLDNVVVLFDEMDPLIRAREFRLQESGTTIADYVIPGMLPKLQELHDRCPRANMMFVLTTNFRDTVDSAISRRGRIDMEGLVLPFTRRARREQLRRILAQDLGEKVLSTTEWRTVVRRLANEAVFMVYRDLYQLCVAVRDEYSRLGPARARKVLDGETVKEALSSYGVRVESYDRKSRPHAGRELICALHRLLNRRPPKNDVLEDPVRLRRAFQRVTRALHKRIGLGEIYRRAERVANSWC